MHIAPDIDWLERAYDDPNATWADQRESFARTALAVVDEFAPGFSSQVIDMQVLLPPDIEEILNIPNGTSSTASCRSTSCSGSDRRRASPTTAARSGALPLRLLGYPGGGVSGIPGHNAAREILKDRRRLAR